jgi:hypothetical protein
MTMRMQRIHTAPLIALLVICTAAAGTTLARMSVAQMTRAAKNIVRARCLTNSTAWDAGEIWTFTTFEVEENWKGARRDKQIIVRLLGGTVGGLTSTVSGVPRFVEGEEVILFLEPTARGDFSIVSWMQGTFRVRRDRASGHESVTQDTAGFSTFDSGTRRFESSGIDRVSLIAFRTAVATALHDASGEKR